MSGQRERDRAALVPADRSLKPPLAARMAQGVRGESIRTPFTRRFSERKYFAEPGQRFGRLTVIRETLITTGRRGQPVRPKRGAECRCDCGTVATVPLSDLFRGEPDEPGSGRTRSCGCLRRDVMAANARRGVQQAGPRRRPAVAAERERHLNRYQRTGTGGPVHTGREFL